MKSSHKHQCKSNFSFNEVFERKLVQKVLRETTHPKHPKGDIGYHPKRPKGEVGPQPKRPRGDVGCCPKCPKGDIGPHPKRPKLI